MRILNNCQNKAKDQKNEVTKKNGRGKVVWGLIVAVLLATPLTMPVSEVKAEQEGQQIKKINEYQAEMTARELLEQASHQEARVFSQGGVKFTFGNGMQPSAVTVSAPAKSQGPKITSISASNQLISTQQINFLVNLTPLEEKTVEHPTGLVVSGLREFKPAKSVKSIENINKEWEKGITMAEIAEQLLMLIIVISLLQVKTLASEGQKKPARNSGTSGQNNNAITARAEAKLAYQVAVTEKKCRRRVIGISAVYQANDRECTNKFISGNAQRSDRYPS
jgi:hypothetical protein